MLKKPKDYVLVTTYSHNCAGFTSETFNWASYLKGSKFQAAPKHLFTNTQVAVSKYKKDSMVKHGHAHLHLNEGCF